MSHHYADPPRTFQIVAWPTGRSHVAAGFTILCDPNRELTWSQQVLDSVPTCGWCRLILATTKGA